MVLSGNRIFSLDPTPVNSEDDAWAAYHFQAFRLPDTDGELNESLRPDQEPGSFRFEGENGHSLGYSLYLFYTMGEVAGYEMHFDPGMLPFRIW